MASSGEYAHSEDGGCRRRGEVEMQDMAEARPLPRRPSLPDLTAYAGNKGGAPMPPSQPQHDFPLLGTHPKVALNGIN